MLLPNMFGYSHARIKKSYVKKKLNQAKFGVRQSRPTLTNQSGAILPHLITEFLSFILMQ